MRDGLVAQLRGTDVLVEWRRDERLVGFLGDVVEHALHLLHSLFALAFHRTPAPAKLFNRPFFNLRWDGLALRIVLGYA